MQAGKFIDHITSSRHYEDQLAHVQVLPARPAVYGPGEASVAPLLQQALAQMGITKLYTHQEAAVMAAARGANVVVVTGTASGKTLCYNLPVLDGLLAQPNARALYLFPTKALAQDQLRGLLRFKELAPDLPLCAGTYDGDTPATTRRRLRDGGNCVLTNPDMLHSGIMPHHAGWSEFFANLRWVVIDEIHTYRGVFGSHVANVLHRLQRICKHYGASPQFLCSSATIANPAELAGKLTGRQFTVVDEDGSPAGKKYFAFWNPPLYGETMERRSPYSEATELFVQLVRDRTPTIVFARAVVAVELLQRYARSQLERYSPALAKAVRAYRGGYLPSERREIERQLFSGELLGVASTNALELGIDIGSLDACIMVGFPGSIASAWQQAGRAGRGREESLVVLVAQNAPIDQYLMQHPDYFFGRSCEHAVIDPENPHVVMSHLRAAAFELPVHVTEEVEFGPYGPALVELLAEDRQLIRRGNHWYWMGKGYPADDFTLRNATEVMYTIVDTTEDKNQVIGSTCEVNAFTQLHTEAVYLHDGETYFVSKLDITEKVAYVHRVDPDYYTQSVTDRQVRVESTQAEMEWRGSKVSFGDVDVTFITYLYKKVKFADRDSLGFGKIDLPPITLETCAMWLSPTLEAFRLARAAGRSPMEGLVGIANVLAEVMPLYAMCDPADVGTLVDSSNTGAPTLFLFDKVKGGAGFARKAYELVEEVMTACCELIMGCGCHDGCPSCVGAPLPPSALADVAAEAKGRIPDKESALIILHALLQRAYVPRPATRPSVPGVEGANGAIAAGAAETAVCEEPTIEREPAAPLPENLEMRLRLQMQHLKAKRRNQ